MTREEAVETLKKMKWGAYECGVTGDALDKAIDALKQESVLDKIRAEIANLDNLNPTYLSDGRYTIDKTKVLLIIDKYKAESEEV